MVKSVKAHHFTEEEIKEAREAFDHIDIDHSGRLDEEELTKFAKEAEIQEELVPFMMFFFNEDGKGVSFDNFLKFLEFIEKVDEDPLYLFRVLFDKIDADKSGEIDLNEFKKFSDVLGLGIDDAELKELFDQVDLDHSGSISFDEVVKLLTLNQ